jgi:hypothetical protein
MQLPAAASAAYSFSDVDVRLRRKKIGARKTPAEGRECRFLSYQTSACLLWRLLSPSNGMIVGRAMHRSE